MKAPGGQQAPRCFLLLHSDKGQSRASSKNFVATFAFVKEGQPQYGISFRR